MMSIVNSILLNKSLSRCYLSNLSHHCILNSFRQGLYTESGNLHVRKGLARGKFLIQSPKFIPSVP